MKKRVLFVLPILSIFLFSSVALSKNVREGLDKKENRASSKLEVLSPKKVIKPRVVKAMPVLQSAEEEIILEDLKEARLVGDRAAARAIQLELKELHGILPNTPPLTDNEQEEVIFEEPSQGPQPLPFRWVDGDILINNSLYDVVKPAMASALNGDLYVAMEDRGDDTLHVYKSTDDGATWSPFLTLYSLGNDNRNPSIAVTDDYVFVAYEVWYSDTNRGVRVYSKPTDGSLGHGAWVLQNESDTPDYICPRICTDYLEYPGDPYVYVTYAVNVNGFYYYVYFSKSIDDGLTFSAPVNVTVGSAYTTFATKPDIAHGQSGLFITFCKPGNTSSDGFVDEVVWVTKSPNFGDIWNTPVQLTDYKKCYHPRIAAAHGSAPVVVAYTLEYSSTDNDVFYNYSINGGSTWYGGYYLSSSTLDENSVALSVSNYNGRFHAAYNYDEHDIRYRSADTGSPNSWSSAQTINETNYASQDYPRPTISVNPTMPETDEACIAWTDYRSTWYDIYFDSASLASLAPVLDDISVDGCISELCEATIAVTATDPSGGALSYDWTALDGGSIIGAGDTVSFDPPGPSLQPACLPYRVNVAVTSDASGLTSEQTVEITVKLAGDANGDGVVNILDKVMVRNAFGQSGDNPADVNCDSVVNILDKVIIRNQFGQSGCACP